VRIDGKSLLPDVYANNCFSMRRGLSPELLDHIDLEVFRRRSVEARRT
jgi:hypothetical protein